MKTEDILNLDYRSKENQLMIQKALRKIKPLSKIEEDKIPLEKLEKFIFVSCRKYQIQTQAMLMSFKESDESTIYSLGLKTTDENEWLGTIYGCCLYEMFAKMSIKIYALIKTEKIKKR